MPTFVVTDARLDYDITGDEGPLVVQLHGLTSSRERDAHLGLDLGRALRGHRVLRYDARGHGGSSGSRNEQDYRWESLAGDLLALLDHVAPGEKVHGIGPSMGTGTLLHAAIRDPDRFATLTLVVPPTAYKARRTQAEHYRHGADLIESHGLAAFLALGDAAPVPPALADAPQTFPEIAEDLLPTVMRGAAATDLPDRKAIAEITVPTLILAWSGDPAHPVRTANRLHELIEGSRLVVARTPYGVMAWPGLFAEHVITA
ncbi:alpha/beta fold hydrolase [Microbacterium sp. C7(2022)]|uniref:alpha/beta fold hydrolase n=1 Tax=Microbacterium sp. C7(2022) TaxID=2992759 RepID=UPI00237AD7C5|nr:alpha/beta hydrolase [Microbacterium sp. C7(2022)]MDE0546529.1 alpha/beta hydrolase [Microbacterium sp. C7(2022)]